MNCRVCGQPVRVIPTGSKLKDMYNKVVLVMGKVCMRCAIAYKESVAEADKMTYEERAAKTLERMKARGMSDKEIKETVEAADKKEVEIANINKDKILVDIETPQIIEETLDKPVIGVTDEMLKEKEIINEGETMVEAYCMKCKVSRKMKDSKEVKMKNGRPATKGVCEKCGTSMYKIGGK